MELFDKKFIYFVWDDSLKGKKGFLADSIPSIIDMVENHGPKKDKFRSVNSYNKSGNKPFTAYGEAYYTFFYHDPLYEYKWAWKQGKKVEVYGFIGISRAWIEVTDDWKWEENYEYRVKSEKPEMCTACIDDEGVVSTMKACEWSRNKGRQLIEGTEEECKDYAVENYCKKCIHEVSICCSPRLGCQGFKEKEEPKLLESWHCKDCVYEERDFREEPCSECVFIASSNKSSNWEPKKKRRWTNRELAKWIAQGNGQVKHHDGNYTLNTFNAYDVHDDNKPCPDYLVIRGWDETEWHEPEAEE